MAIPMGRTDDMLIIRGVNHIKVSLKEPRTIARSKGKAKRVWDKRQETN
jgi:phenylacetate-coenzyme A ligase PaaK-like adenylate-forming protein